MSGQHGLVIGHATPAQHPDPEKLVISGFGTFQPVKIVDSRPVGIRWLVKPDGERVLQFARAWSRGFNEHGLDWEDVPEVLG